MFLDTSGLFCYLDVDSHNNSEAVAYFDAAGPKLTHNYVLAELVALAGARRLPRATALSFVADIMDHPDVEVFWVTPELHHSALNMLFKQQDKAYSLCDAVSFVLMRERGETDALTTDHHFEQAGLTRLLRP